MGLAMTFANFLFLTVFLMTPRVVLKFGVTGLFVSLGIYVAACAVTIPHVSQLRFDGGPSAGADGRTSIGGIKAAGLALGLLSLNIGLGAIWSFAERIGHEIGLHAGEIGSVLAASSIAMIAGSAAAGWMGDRFGNRWPLLLGSLACGSACYATSMSTGLSGYAAALFAFNFCYLMLGPFALAGVPSALDPSGRLAATASGIMWLAYSGGVAVGGLIADRASVKGIGLFALYGCVLAGCAFFYAATASRRRSVA
jgi:MFS family permease